jgi:transmembrane sensor
MDKLPENITPELILAFLKSQIGKDEALVVQNWIDSSPENHHQFEQFKVVWEETGKLIPAPVDVDIDDAWNKMSFRIDAFDEKSEITQKEIGRTIPFRKYLLRVAAVLIPFIVISSIYLILNQKPKQIIRETTAQTLKDTLSDGSIVALNKQSKISYPQKFIGNKREVEMEGEIFFEVKPDSTKPFIIHAENVMIKVLGTSFNVRSFADSSEIEVKVKTGHVMVYSLRQNYADTVSLILKAGETGIYYKSTNEIKKVELPIKAESQQSGITLVFNRTRLVQAIDSIQKKYGVTISLQDENLRNLHISTTFKNLSIDSIIDVLKNTFDLKVKRQGSNYILKQNEE